jgi:hypothetical protein
MVSIVGARCFAPDIGHALRAPTLQGAQKLRSEAHLSVCRNDEVAAQRRRLTFYEVIKIYLWPLAIGLWLEGVKLDTVKFSIIIWPVTAG